MISKKLIILLCLAVQALKLSGQENRRIRLSPVLQSHMVIQQNKPFKVWGYAAKGSSVRVSADWLATDVIVTTDTCQQFMAILNVPNIQPGDYTAHCIHIEADNQSIILDSLLIGDVWICAGQSNMQFSLKEDAQADRELLSACHPNIRLFNTALNFSTIPIDSVGGKWEICTPATAKNFSAIAYYMAKKLQDSLQYPIGIIFTGIGASAAQAYVPEAALAADPLLNKTYLAPYLESPRSKERVDGGFSFEKVTRPFLLYNAMIHPFTKLSVSGFCWYQGEANHMERASYIQLTQVLINTWRHAFKQGLLPFYLVQIAPFNHDQHGVDLVFDAFFREAQERVSELENTAMIVSMDVGEAGNLHPRQKKPLGERLAATALNRAYGRLQVAYRGPKIKNVQFMGKRAIVQFEEQTVRGGLCTRDGEAAHFFFMAGKDRIFYPAEAIIKGQEIELMSDRVKKPVAVRYAFYNDPVTNLQNSFGFPAEPFRTDQWPEL